MLVFVSCPKPPFKFSRKFKTLVPLNSDFTAFKPPNSLENSSAPSVQTSSNHPPLLDFSPFKLLEINVLTDSPKSMFQQQSGTDQ